MIKFKSLNSKNNTEISLDVYKPLLCSSISHLFSIKQFGLTLMGLALPNFVFFPSYPHTLFDGDGRRPRDPGRPRGSGQPGARPQREANTRVPAELEFSGAGGPRGGFKKL
jgi:hypothetical protein